MIGGIPLSPESGSIEAALLGLLEESQFNPGIFGEGFQGSPELARSFA